MRGLILFAYLRSPQERAHPSQWLNTIAEYFEGRQEGNSEQSADHAPEVGPKKKSEQDGDRIQG
jgi:hypothetical protein